MTKSNTTYSGLEIAVVGMSCKFPGADNIHEFWNFLEKGETSIQKITDEQLSKAGVDTALMEHPDYVPVGSFVREKDAFDHQFFKYTPSEALVMDPQIRLFHQCVWEALEDAAIDPETYKLPIGIYSGAGDNIMWRAQSMLGGSSATDSFSSEQLSAHEFISTLISYKLGLNGPAMYINTACSTSLVAIHTACRALLTGELRVALAGGIRIGSAPEQGYLYEEGMILSKDGLCRAYDKSANGTVGGEGGGVVVLKKLKDAIKDGDRIYGLVKSSAVNNDGKRKVGYTAPSVDGQSECIRMAHKIAGITPNQVQFLEGHGTATVLGDSIELKAIKNIFGKDRNNPLLLGSLKSNLGHMDAGAGVGGFIKSILSVYNKKFPATLNFEVANTEIFGEKMQVASDLTELQNEEQLPIRGGVSSFGIGGTNAHIIVEEYNESNEIAQALTNEPFLFQFSAKSGSALLGYCEKMVDFVSKHKNASIQDIAFTLNRRKKNWSFRKAIVANSKGELLTKLESFLVIGKTKKVDAKAITTEEIGELPDVTNLEAYERALQQLGDRWSSGENIETAALFTNKGKLITLPTYAWDKHRFNAIASINLSGGAVNTVESTMKILEDDTVKAVSAENLPQNDFEKAMCKVFTTVFGTDVNDRNTSFFDLGGDSLKEMVCIRHLKEEFNYELTLNDFFAGDTVKELAARIKELPAEASKAVVEKEAVTDSDLLPISYNQRNYFSPLQFGEENIVLDLSVKQLNKEILHASFMHLFERHEILRVNYVEEASGWKQKIVPMEAFEFPFKEMTMDTAGSQSVAEIIEAERNLYFDKGAKAFIRVHLVNVSDAESVIILTVHHSIADGFSINIIRDELFGAYSTMAQGNALELPPLASSYIDFVASQQDYLQSEKGKEDSDYWLSKLKGQNMTLVEQLPDVSPSGRIDLLRLTIENKGWKKLEKLVKKEKITKQNFVLAAVTTFLKDQLNRDDIVLFSTNSGRYLIGMEDVKVDNLIGFFVNLIPHQIVLDANKNIMQSVHQSFSNDLQHSAYPFEKMVDDHNWMEQPDMLGKAALFNYHNYNQNIDVEFGESKELRTLEMQSKFLLNIICSEYNNGISIDFGVDQAMNSVIDIHAMKEGVEKAINNFL